jgi:opacity protein-like surface antigen
MFKKIILTCILTCGISAALADSSPYVGVSVGVNNANFKFQDATNRAIPFSTKGYTGGFFAGFGDTTGLFYLGAEAFGNNSSTKTTTKSVNTTTGTANVTLRQTYSYGVDLVPGFRIGNKGLLYGKAGLVRSRFRINQTPNPITNTSGTTNHTANGKQWGVGLEITATQNWTIRGEYVYTSYRTVSAYGNKITPHTKQINFGVAYQLA